jgi:lysophospholipid acyltransferase (LPLAT)-like uncharacterized protein
MKKRSRWRKARRRIWRWLALRLVHHLGVVFMRVFVGTCRTRVVGWDEQVASEHRAGRAVIFVLWHNRLIVPVWFFRHRNIHVLVSQHGDGELITRVLRRVGFQAIRGSAERSPGAHAKGGMRALHAMARAGRAGYDLAFTPDGPRGPIYSVAPGLITLARLARLKVVPVGIEIARCWRLRSWDRFRIPKPFSRAVCWFGPGLTIPDDEQTARDAIVEAMLRVTRTAASELGIDNPFADAGLHVVGARKK